MEPLEKATAILAAALGAATPEVAELLTSDDAVKQLTDRFEAKLTDVRDKADQRATSKTRTVVEKAFKAAGVEDASFEALPAAIEALQSKSANDSAKDLSPEQLLKLKPVVDALNAERLNTQKAVDAAVLKTKSELSEQQAAFLKQRTEAAVRGAVAAEIKALNPNFIAGKEAAQEKRLIDEILREGRFQLDDNGGILLTDEDGAVLPGKLGNGVATLADFVRDRADEAYGLPTSKPRESAGMTQAEIDASRTAGQYAGPKTDDEFASAVIKAQDDPQAVEKLNTEYAAYQQSQK